VEKNQSGAFSTGSEKQINLNQIFHYYSRRNGIVSPKHSVVCPEGLVESANTVSMSCSSGRVLGGFYRPSVYQQI
jgi:hypothetical protein